MAARHHRPLYGTHARQVEHLLGLEAWSLRAVELDRGGPASYYVLRFRQQQFAGETRRTFRIPAKRVRGYQQRSATARPRDVRYRAAQSRRRFAFWLLCWLDAPVVDIAICDGDIGVIDELRAAILLAASGGAAHADLWLAAWERAA